ncbi:MAG: carbon-nitrogen hydrolase family protein [Alphaproteobacteria bacterium]|nr:carbon-nitrogen hydrolase family protein [Alphaproteobacteria bacterium]
MAETMKVACIQMNSGADIRKNLDVAADLIREAASKGAEFILTPEITDQVVSNRAEKLDKTYTQEDHPGVAAFADMAKELSVHLLIGSMVVKVTADKVANRSFLFAPDGKLKATYDKIHLYDVDLPTGESHRESKLIVGGDRAVVAPVNGDFTLGMSICYDVRFAHLFRDLAKAGANILSIPAAFTVTTGKAHWETLLRARAIETGSYVLAAAQSGNHDGARNTYGHSMIIGPWGEVLADAGQGVNIIYADIESQAVTKARNAIPCLQHDREYGKP